MQQADYQPKSIESRTNGPESTKTTEKAPERVGEWPRLLTKKFLAIQFDCYERGRINIRKFRAYVLTTEVLEKAGIDPETAYSIHTKTFNAIQSMSLTKILRVFCLVCMILFSGSLSAQKKEVYPYSGSIQVQKDTIYPNISTPWPNDPDTTYMTDTTAGLVVIMDSTIRMQMIKPGQYAYQSVVGLIVLDAIMVRYYMRIMSAKTGFTDPVERSRRFFLITGEPVREEKILMFKTANK